MSKQKPKAKSKHERLAVYDELIRGRRLFLANPEAHRDFLDGYSSRIGNGWVMWSGFALGGTVLLWILYVLVFPQRRVELFIAAFQLLLSVILMVLLRMMFLTERRNVRLSHEGWVVRGDLIKMELIRGRITRNHRVLYYLYLDYKFTTPDGRWVTHYDERSRIVRNDLLEKYHPTQGTPLAVLYVDDDLYRVM